MNHILTLDAKQFRQHFHFKRLFIPMSIVVLLSSEVLRPIIIDSLADAFLQVSIFVAFTLSIYYFLLDKFPMLELSYVRQHAPHFEIPVAAILGALPGCGGAIIVVTQFTKHQASFGSVVAVLTATMGDAAFLLLATKPLDGVIILAIGLSVGILSGIIVNKIHPSDYLQPKKASKAVCVNGATSLFQQKLGKVFWSIWMLPSLLIGGLLAMQFNFNAVLENLDTYIGYFGAVGAFSILLLWAFASKDSDDNDMGSYQDFASEDKPALPYSKFNKVMQDTHFVTAWVVTAFVLYEVAVNIFSLDLGTWFAHYGVFAPLVGLVIGLLPGCGPQILVTTLYIQGIVPFSALAANAVSNDGDALFPAIALAPKAAIVATLYSAIPALVVGYGAYFLA